MSSDYIQSAPFDELIGYTIETREAGEEERRGWRTSSFSRTLGSSTNSGPNDNSNPNRPVTRMAVVWAELGYNLNRPVTLEDSDSDNRNREEATYNLNRLPLWDSHLNLRGWVWAWEGIGTFHPR